MAAQNKVNAPVYSSSAASPFEDRYAIEGEREAAPQPEDVVAGGR